MFLVSLCLLWLVLGVGWLLVSFMVICCLLSVFNSVVVAKVLTCL